MEATYAVAWQFGDGPVHVGKLALGPDLVLEGATGSIRLPRGDLLAVEPAGTSQRLRDRRTLLLLRAGADPLAIAVLDGAGTAQELRERLTVLSEA